LRAAYRVVRPQGYESRTEQFRQELRIPH
jgi:hypothetical protein